MLTSLLLTLCRPVHATSKGKDVVIMTNGDRITGEVKRLQNGVLYLRTDYVAENFGVDWAQVQSIESSRRFQITLVNGTRMIGQLKREVAQERDQEILIIGENGDTRVAASNVAEISIQKETFWRQLVGNIDAGYSFTSGNSQTTINSDASANYATPNWAVGTGISNSFSGQSGASRTNRIDGTLTLDRFLSRNSYLGLLNDYLHSSQQDLTLRTTLGGGYGRYLIRTDTTGLRWIAGVVDTWESFSTVSARPSNSNGEALLGAAYDSYRFRFGELHLQTNLFPGLSDSGRIRVTTNNALRIKLPNNFYYSLGFWDNYDSRPPATAKKNELGITSSIGWTF